MANIAYIRVSTTHQNTERQEVAMPENIDRTFIEKVSGKDTNRPEFKKMMEYVREGDVVYFESFSRISRSLHDLLGILDEFERKGVQFVSLKEGVQTTGATGRLVVAVLGAISAYEREINAERREYGYRKACEDNRVGRPAAQMTEKLSAAIKEWHAGKITAQEAWAQASVTKTTFYKLVKENNLQKPKK